MAASLEKLTSYNGKRFELYNYPQNAQKDNRHSFECSQPQNLDKNSEREKNPKLYVGGLPINITEDDLWNIFGQYGDVQDVVIMYEKGTQRQRGFGFVTFYDYNDANYSASLTHSFEGKTQECKKAKPREHFGDSMQKDPGFKTNRLFIGGLPPELSDREFKEFFSKFGEIKDCVIIPNKETKQSRCFGFVQFVESESVEKIVDRNYDIKINNRLVDIKKAQPKETCQELISEKNGADLTPNYGTNYYENSPLPQNIQNLAELMDSPPIFTTPMTPPNKRTGVYKHRWLRMKALECSKDSPIKPRKILQETSFDYFDYLNKRALGQELPKQGALSKVKNIDLQTSNHTKIQPQITRAKPPSQSDLNNSLAQHSNFNPGI